MNFKATHSFRSPRSLERNLIAQLRAQVEEARARYRNFEIYIAILLRRAGIDPMTEPSGSVSVRFLSDEVADTPLGEFSSEIDLDSGVLTLTLALPKTMTLTSSVEWALADGPEEPEDTTDPAAGETPPAQPEPEVP